VIFYAMLRAVLGFVVLPLSVALDDDHLVGFRP
jgi:hypothetical protein